MIKINYYNPLQMNAGDDGGRKGRWGKRGGRRKGFMGVREDILRESRHF